MRSLAILIWLVVKFEITEWDLSSYLFIIPFKLSVCCQHIGECFIFLVDNVYPVTVSFTLSAIFKYTLRNGFSRHIFCTQCQLYKLQLSCVVLKLKKTPLYRTYFPIKSSKRCLIVPFDMLSSVLENCLHPVFPNLRDGLW